MPSFREIVSFPPVWLVLGMLLALVFRYRCWRKREAVMRALAAKYDLREGTVGTSAPDPELSGFIFPAEYPRFLVGKVEGVPVAVFDFEIGVGRGQKYGSGVGVGRVVQAPWLQREMPGRLVLRRHDGWTFVATEPRPLIGGDLRMQPVKMETLLWRLLEAAEVEPGRWSVQPSREGEVHIRPRHPQFRS